MEKIKKEVRFFFDIMLHALRKMAAVLLEYQLKPRHSFYFVSNSEILISAFVLHSREIHFFQAATELRGSFKS